MSASISDRWRQHKQDVLARLAELKFAPVYGDLKNAKPSADGWITATCPEHEDSRPSFRYNTCTGQWICNAGCGKGDVFNFLKLRLKLDFKDALNYLAEQLGIEPPGAGSASVATYSYADEAGELLFQVVRFPGKVFRQRRPDGKGGWIWNLDGVRRVPYRLAGLIARLGEPVCIVEGEKDAERLYSEGRLATTNSGGAGKWRDEYGQFLKDRAVIVLPDNDKPGRDHAAQVARSLHGIAASVRVIELPDLLEKGDISDWLLAGHTLEELDALVAATPPWTPSVSQAGHPSTPITDRQHHDIVANDWATPQRGGHGDSGAQSVRERVLALFEPENLFADPEGETYARVRRARENRCFDEVVALRSKIGRHLLLGLYREKHGTSPHAQGFEEGLRQLEAVAVRTVVQIGLRTMQVGDDVVIDLCDDDWNQVIITRDGWSMRDSLTDPGPPFRRGAGAQPLPIPKRGGSLHDLRPFLNVANDDDFRFTCGWGVAALTPRGPYPVLDLSGEHGAAKSTTARALVSLTDPNLAPLIDEPRDNHDLSVICGSRHVLALDNLSGLNDELKNGICRLSTGGGHVSRRLFTNGEVCIWQATRPVLLTGIVNLAVADDLTDRSLAITLPPLPETSRRRETDFWREFEEQRPYFFGAFLDALVLSLRDQDAIQFAQLPRMADFAARAAAAAPAFGCTADEFLTAYSANRRNAVEAGLEASALARVLHQFMSGRQTWSGIYGDLLGALNGVVDEQSRNSRGWPASARGLANQLRRLAPGLRAVGVDVLEMGKGKHGMGVAIVQRSGARGAQGVHTPPLTLLPIIGKRGEEGGEGGDIEADDVHDVHQVQPGSQEDGEFAAAPQLPGVSKC